MFQNLSDRLAVTFKKLKGHGKLNESNIAESMREVRLALLEADVNYKAVKDFVARVQERAMGQEVLRSLTPGQQVIKVVHQELVLLMGGEAKALDLNGRPPLVFMLAGLQGSGKTTSCAKLALALQKRGRRPLLVAADLRRPAAVEQLRKLGEQIKAPVHSGPADSSPLEVCLSSLRRAALEEADVIILDTAGRLQLDEPLMDELAQIKDRLKPQEILLVADAMTGQEAVNVAEAFHRRLGLTGVLLSKMEGDARGGAALSIKAVVGVPIKLMGMGEKLEALEVFHPDRVVSRILGMGDVLTLVEKASQEYDQRQSEDLARKLANDSFTLEDFRGQLQQMKKLGSLESVLQLLPGMGKLKTLKNFTPDEKELTRTEAIINSMTGTERANADIINASRRRRIAAGAGVGIADVNKLLKNFQQARKTMKALAKLGPKKGMRRLLGGF
ncbi:MAG: signal recognition particle protein [Desulfarculales bacterium]|jgi:signal recognition particle subunit SRP54|nr:signal recognition particle protein [Desulfarculales bacterium]